MEAKRRREMLYELRACGEDEEECYDQEANAEDGDDAGDDDDDDRAGLLRMAQAPGPPGSSSSSGFGSASCAAVRAGVGGGSSLAGGNSSGIMPQGSDPARVPLPFLRCLPTARQRRGWELATVAVLCGAWLFGYFCRTHMYVSSTLFKSEEGISQAEYGMMMTAGTAVYALGKFVYPLPIERFGSRAGLLFTLLGSSTVSVLFTLGHGSAAFFTLMWMLMRATQPAGWIAIVRAIKAWIPASRQGRTMAVVSLSFFCGDVMTRTILSGILHHRPASWREVFVSAAGLTSLMVFPVLLYLQESPAAVGLALVNAPGQHYSWSYFKKNFRQLFHIRRFVILCVLSFVLTAIRETFLVFSSEYLQKSGFSVPAAGAISPVFSLSGIPSCLLTGFLVDRYPPAHSGYIVAVFLSLLLVPLLALGFEQNPSEGQAVAMMAVSGFFANGPYSLMCGALTLQVARQDQVGTAAGLVDCAGFVGAMFMMSLSSWLSMAAMFKTLFFVTVAGAVGSVAFSRAPLPPS